MAACPTQACTTYLRMLGVVMASNQFQHQLLPADPFGLAIGLEQLISNYRGLSVAHLYCIITSNVRQACGVHVCYGESRAEADHGYPTWPTLAFWPLVPLGLLVAHKETQAKDSALPNRSISPPLIRHRHAAWDSREDLQQCRATSTSTDMADPAAPSVTKLQELLLLPTLLETLLEANSQGRPQLHGLASACRELRDLVSKA